MLIATKALALVHTTSWLHQDDSWPWVLFTWPAISWWGISWVTLPLHCLFLFLATVTKERAIPGTQLAGLWQTLMYGCPLTRFQVNLANCACKEFEHIPDWIFRIKPAFTRYQMLDVPSWSKNWDASGAPTPHDVLRKQSCFHLFHHLMAFSHHKIAIIKSCSLMTLRNL